MKTCAIVYNPNSGKGKKNSSFEKGVASILKKKNYEAVFFATKKAGDATDIILKLDDS